MRSLRRISEVFVVAVLVCAVAGCGGGGSSTSTTTIGSSTISTSPPATYTQVPSSEENVPLCATGEKSTSAKPCTSAPKTTSTAVEAAVTKAWKTFFNGATPVAQRVALLAGGDRFSSTIKSLSQNPLASKTSATVSKVVSTGPTTAAVTFTIYLAGAPVLANVTGSTVLENGKWLVDPTSLCKFLALQGSVPSACSAAGSSS